jgi:DNA-binding NarL/FixJ family response regulator
MLALALAAAVVADSALVRSGLASILGRSGELSVVAEASPADASALPSDGVDVVVCEVGDEAAAEALLEVLPSGPVLALVGDPNGAATLVKAGVRGVVGRGASAETLAAASLAVAKGLRVFDEAALTELLSRAPSGADSTLLTPREREVLGLVAEGLSNRLIAERLGISEHTVKFHVGSLVEKIGADTRTDAVTRAVRRGMLAL